MSRFLLAPFRLLGLFLLLVTGVSCSAFISLFISNKNYRRRFQTRLYHRFSPWILTAVGARVRIDGPVPPRDGASRLIVANHVSDLDVIVLNAQRPCVFITSVEMRETPLLGWLALYGGSYFVERRNSARLRTELSELEALLRSGVDVVLFPEGTSSNGEEILPFHNALFAPAIRAQVVLQPVCLQYQRIGGEAVSTTNRDRVFYYGDMGFFGHARRLACAGGLDLALRWRPASHLQNHDDRKEVSERAYLEIAAVYEAVREA